MELALAPVARPPDVVVMSSPNKKPQGSPERRRRGTPTFFESSQTASPLLPMSISPAKLRLPPSTLSQPSPSTAGKRWSLLSRAAVAWSLVIVAILALSYVLLAISLQGSVRRTDPVTVTVASTPEPERRSAPSAASTTTGPPLSAAPGSAPGLATSHSPLTTLAIEAAIDVDGDIRVWKTDVLMRLLPTDHASDAYTFWHRAARQGCGGEVTARVGSMILAQLRKCEGAASHPSGKGSSLGASAPRALARGRVAWLADSSSRFVLALDDSAGGTAGGGTALSVEGEAQREARVDLRAADAIPFAEVDGASLAQLVTGLREMPTGVGGAYDPPLHFTIRA